MKLIDTHCHLFLEEFDNDRDDAVERAISQGVEQMILPNVDSKSLDPLKQIGAKYPKNLFIASGLHPTSVKENYISELDAIEKFLNENKCVAIGEIGIDLYWDKSHLKEQLVALEIQLNWAKDRNLPVLLHCRESLNEVFELVKRNMPLRGIFHAFSGTIEDARKVIDLGFYLGIGGVVTYKNSGLDKIVSQLSINNLVLETDAPYLTPVPHRGKRNEPAYIAITASKIAELLQISVEEIAKTTTANALRLFGLSE